MANGNPDDKDQEQDDSEHDQLYFHILIPHLSSDLRPRFLEFFSLKKIEREAQKECACDFKIIACLAKLKKKLRSFRASFLQVRKLLLHYIKVVLSLAEHVTAMDY